MEKLMGKTIGKGYLFFAPLHKTGLHLEEKNTALPYLDQDIGTLHRTLYQADTTSVFPS